MDVHIALLDVEPAGTASESRRTRLPGPIDDPAGFPEPAGALALLTRMVGVLGKEGFEVLSLGPPDCPLDEFELLDAGIFTAIC